MRANTILVHFLKLIFTLLFLPNPDFLDAFYCSIISYLLVFLSLLPDLKSIIITNIDINTHIDPIITKNMHGYKYPTLFECLS